MEKWGSPGRALFQAARKRFRSDNVVEGKNQGGLLSMKSENYTDGAPP